MLLIWL